MGYRHYLIFIIFFLVFLPILILALIELIIYLKCYRIVSYLEFIRDHLLLYHLIFLENIKEMLNLVLDVLLNVFDSLIQRLLVFKKPENFSTLNWYLYSTKIHKFQTNSHPTKQ